MGFTARTQGSELFVNPLMGVYFGVDLPALAASVGYLDRLRDTTTMFEVALAIESYRDQVAVRPARAFPH